VALKSGVVYAMTKAAMVQMTFNMACEWAMDNIRVNVVAPWYIDTPLARLRRKTSILLFFFGYLTSICHFCRPVFDNPQNLQLILDRTPFKRVGYEN
jgi:Tropinone reductase 1